MKTPTHPAAAEGRRQRSDGAEARERLLHTALRLFAEKGFAKTSTREIAQGAGVNIASISYYFGDKAGLYRAAFIEPLGCQADQQAWYEQPQRNLRQSLQLCLATILQPLKQGDLLQLCTRLHFREMLEPTGLWNEKIDNGIKPSHEAMVALLTRHLGLAEADDDVHRLAFSIAGLALHLFVTRDVVDALRPQLIAGTEAIDRWTEHMVDAAEAMVKLEVKRRKAGPPAAPAKKSSKPIPSRQEKP